MVQREENRMKEMFSPDRRRMEQARHCGKKGKYFEEQRQDESTVWVP
jgi:hypothetical protein